MSTYFLSANRNKASICLNLKDSADRGVLLLRQPATLADRLVSALA